MTKDEKSSTSQEEKRKLLFFVIAILKTKRIFHPCSQFSTYDKTILIVVSLDCGNTKNWFWRMVKLRKQNDHNHCTKRDDVVCALSLSDFDVLFCHFWVLFILSKFSYQIDTKVFPCLVTAECQTSGSLNLIRKLGVVEWVVCCGFKRIAIWKPQKESCTIKPFLVSMHIHRTMLSFLHFLSLPQFHWIYVSNVGGYASFFSHIPSMLVTKPEFRWR